MDDSVPQPLFSHSYLLSEHLKAVDKHGVQIKPTLP